MKARMRSELPQLTLVGGMFVLAALRWSSVGDSVPVHYGLTGEADRYGSKFEGLLLMPLIALGVYLLMRFAPRIDPGRANYERFWGTYTIIRTVVIMFLAGTYLLSLRSIDSGRTNVATVALMMGVLFIALGAVLGKVRPNWFVGIRTPWTLSSKNSWTRTHRLGGWLLIAAGAITISAGLLFPRTALLVGVVAVVVVAIWSLIYSYVEWRNDPNKLPPAGTTLAED